MLLHHDLLHHDADKSPTLPRRKSLLERQIAPEEAMSLGFI